MERIINVLVVCLSSALGGGARYLVSLWVAARGWTAFPWATLIVNVAGCFLIMLIATIAAATTMSTNLRLFLTTGIMGGLTTYSTFDFETTRFLQAHDTSSALLYVGATLVTCFVGGLLGIGVARLVVSS